MAAANLPWLGMMMIYGNPSYSTTRKNGWQYCGSFVALGESQCKGCFEGKEPWIHHGLMENGLFGRQRPWIVSLESKTLWTFIAWFGIAWWKNYSCWMEVVDFLFNESWEGNQDKLVGWIVVQWNNGRNNSYECRTYSFRKTDRYLSDIKSWVDRIIYNKWIIVLGANMFWDPCEKYCYISSLWNQYSLRGGINWCSAKNIAGDACAFWVRFDNEEWSKLFDLWRVNWDPYPDVGKEDLLSVLVKTLVKMCEAKNSLEA